MTTTRIITGIDLETTGLKQTEGHRIVEIAAIMYDADCGKKVGQFVKRIDPQRPIDPAAQRVHGIGYEDVAGLPEFEHYAPSIVKILQNSSVVVAHNGESFDIPFLGNELERVGYEVPVIHYVDTMIDARWATPLGKYPTLGELCFACDVLYEPDKAHAAEYDVEVMMQCYFMAHNKGFFNKEKIFPPVSCG